MSSLYAPLTDSRDDIRLLSIITEPNDTHVTCKLTTTSLSGHPRYTALSYFWGDPKVTEDILVNGRVRSVTITLATALRHIAKHWTSVYPDEERGSLYLWADAVCIDQENDLEKNHQVNLMGEIYRRAELVIAWFGIGGQIDNALANLQLLAKEIEISGRHDLLRLEWLCRFPNLCVDDNGHGDLAGLVKNRSWRDIFDLFRLPYWERVWILQEAAFAKQLVFCTDNVNLAYSDMLTVWQGLSAVKADIRQGLVECPEQLLGTSIWTLLATDFLDWFHVRRLNAIHVHLASLDQQPNSHNGAQSSLVSSLHTCSMKASNPKDYIYGLKDLADLQIEVDYSRSKSVKDVYCDYVSVLLVLLRSAPADAKYESPPLFFLQSSGIGLYDYSLGLPTYAPNFPEESKLKLNSSIFTGYADSGVFLAEASLARIEDAALVLPGVRVDTVTRIDAAPAEHTWRSGACLKYFQDYFARTRNSDRVVPPLQTIVRTLQLNHDRQIDSRFINYTLCLLLCLVPADAENIDAEFRLLGLEPPTVGENGSGLKKSLIRALCPDWGGPSRTRRDMLFQATESELYEIVVGLTWLDKKWRFFNTTTGFIGLAPLKTQPGDLVFVLKECYVPVILRKQEDHYLFVGVCFVLDLMSGSLAAEKVRTGELVIEQIRIL